MGTEKKRRLFGLLTAACIVACICLTAGIFLCRNKEVSEGQVKNDSGAEEMDAKADVTQDGKPERIDIDEETAENPETGEEPTVQVYSGMTGKRIWSLPVNTVHGGYNNVYIYRDDGHASLMTWNPAMWQGNAHYEWKVFDLTEEGEEKVLFSDTLEFRLDRPKKDDIKKLKDFANTLNGYLGNAELLISTEDGKLQLGTENGTGEAPLFDPEEIIREMENFPS